MGDSGIDPAAAAPAPASPAWLHRTKGAASGPVLCEVAAPLNTHHLVPLATVRMTTGTAYLEATGGATAMLEQTAPNQMLESMADIKAARVSEITPLPSDQV